MAAIISMAGNKTMAANSPSPNNWPISVTTKVVPKKIPIHIRPNVKKARQLLRHATVLKNNSWSPKHHANA